MALSNSAMRIGPSKLTSTALSSGESKETLAAEWMTMSHDANICASLGESPSPSVLTSPATTEIRPMMLASNSVPSFFRSRSKASFFRISRRTRSAAGVRRPSRTSNTNSHSGTLNSKRSTRAVPTKPVAPVIAMRLPRRFSEITDHFYHGSLPNGRQSHKKVSGAGRNG